MTPRLLAVVLVLCTLLLVVVMPVAAKGPVDRIVITGPGLDGELEITDDDAVTAALSMAMLEDFTRHVDPPAYLGAGYHMVRYFERENGTYQPFDEVIYYANPSGAPGYVYYLGIVDGGSEYDGHWFRANPDADQVMRQVLSDAGVTLAQESVPLQPYLLVHHIAGLLEVLDPVTLKTLANLPPVGSTIHLLDLVTGPDGRWVYPYSVGKDSMVTQYAVDLADRTTACRLTQTGHILLATYDGALIVEDATKSGQPELEVRDAATFDLLTTIPVPTKSRNLWYFPSPDRRWIYVLAYDDAQAVVHAFDVNRRAFVAEETLRRPAEAPVYRGFWNTESSYFYLIDGQRLFILNPRYHSMMRDGRMPLVSADQVDGNRIDFVTVHQDWLYLYQPVDRRWVTDSGGGPEQASAKGLFAVEWWNTHSEHRVTDLPFVQIIFGDDRFFALSPDEDTNTVDLVVLDEQGQAVIQQRTMHATVSSIAWVWLDPSMVAAQAEMSGAWGCDQMEPTPLPPPAIMPVTATPQPTS